jgi:hypothetical protein
MNEVTQILSGIVAGDPHAAEHLLPLVYDELRKNALATGKHARPRISWPTGNLKTKDVVNRDCGLSLRAGARHDRGSLGDC